MKIRNPDFWVIVGVILLGGLLTRSCSAEGLYDHSGTTQDGVSPGITYFHSDDGNYGWQSDTGGVTYTHGSKRSCTTQHVLGNSRTSCTEW
jgi:hypothetical protein